MQFRVGTLEEVGDHVAAMPVGMRGLEGKAGIFLVALGGKADIIELNLIDSLLGGLLRQRDIKFRTLAWEGSVHTSLPFSRHGLPVLRDCTASSGWFTTRRSSRKMATRAMACIPCECRKRVNFGRSRSGGLCPPARG